MQLFIRLVCAFLLFASVNSQAFYLQRTIPSYELKIPPSFDELMAMNQAERAYNIQKMRNILAAIESMSDPEYYDYSLNFDFNFISNAIAEFEPRSCIFGGHLQTLNTRNKCPLIERCDDGRAKCNPLLFGPDTCLSRSKQYGWKDATARCQSIATKSPAEIAKDLNESQREAWDKLRKRLLEYCQSHLPSDKTACDAIRSQFESMDSYFQSALKDLGKINDKIFPDKATCQDITSPAPTTVTVPDPAPDSTSTEETAASEQTPEMPQTTETKPEQPSQASATNPDIVPDPNLKCYFLPKANSESSTRANIDKTAQDIIACANAKTVQEKAWAIHRWIIENIHYSDTELDAGNGISDTSEVFSKGRGICAGYAYLFERMARAVGIDAKYRTGKVWGTVSSQDPKAWKGWEKTWCDKKTLTTNRTWCGHAWLSIKLENNQIMYIDPTLSDGDAYDHSCKKDTSGNCKIAKTECIRKSAEGYCEITQGSYAYETDEEAKIRRRTLGPTKWEYKLMKSYFGPPGNSPWQDHKLD